jgi:hypothetical protein
MFMVAVQQAARVAAMEKIAGPHLAVAHRRLAD